MRKALVMAGTADPVASRPPAAAASADTVRACTTTDCSALGPIQNPRSPTTNAVPLDPDDS
ncbi:hypothetical protein [Nocardia sp. NPDC004860]|uniref:hypothetical protein n=1 Tax=Nocardia sp. NPDC004860 TaxID=3154557 RepID=UPI0033BBB8DD